MLKRSSLITSANMTSAKNCEVYAFVLATPEYCDWLYFPCIIAQKSISFIPISGPALTWMPQWVSLEMVDPTVLVTPRVKAPAWKILMLISCQNSDADLFTISQRQKGVCSLSRLWDQDAHVVPEKRRFLNLRHPSPKFWQRQQWFLKRLESCRNQDLT